jgi:hypothetical protein
VGVVVVMVEVVPLASRSELALAGSWRFWDAGVAVPGGGLVLVGVLLRFSVGLRVGKAGDSYGCLRDGVLHDYMPVLRTWTCTDMTSVCVFCDLCPRLRYLLEM